MLLRIEQNWKWSNKTFAQTLCVVSNSDEITRCGICFTSNKRLHCASGGGGSLGQKFPFLGTIFSLKIVVLLGKYFRKQTNNLFTWQKNISMKMLPIFLWAPPDGPCSLLFTGGTFLTRLKNRHFWTHFFLTITPKYLLHPETGCSKYFTLCEPFHP